MKCIRVAALGVALATLGEAASAFELKRLVFHETIEISRCERFVAADAFHVGRQIGGRVLGSVGFNFEKVFLPATETDVRVFPLQAWTLRYSADGSSLIEQMGGEQAALVPLCSIYRLIQTGRASHTDTQSNLAFARTPDGRRLMAVHWFVNHDNEWVIGAVDVPHALDWPAGSRVFSNAIVKAADTR